MKAFAVAISLAVMCCTAATSPVWAAAAKTAAETAAAGVCSYVAAAYNGGTEDKLWGYPDPVDIAGDGKLRHVYIVEQGTAHVHSIVASTEPLSAAAQETASNSEVNFYGSIGQDMDLETVPHIFQFKDSYYVVYEEDEGPYDVVKPDVGEICRFKRHFTAALTENRSPALCKSARAGKRFEKLPTRKLANSIVVGDASTLDLPGPHSPVIAQFMDVKLDPAGTADRIGYFKYESSAGAGCQASGVTFLRGRDIENSPRNTVLLAAERDMTNCRGSDAFVIRAGGQNLIEVDGGSAEQQPRPPRLLVRLSGDKMEKVCDVEQRATYSVVPLANAQ
jgi:hypothetical protein